MRHASMASRFLACNRGARNNIPACLVEPRLWLVRGLSSGPVRLLTRMDEEEELPCARVLRQASGCGQGLHFGAHAPLRVSTSRLVGDGGRGVFAAAPIRAGSLVEVCPVLALRKDHVDVACAGMRYFFGGPEGDMLLCVLGFGMLYNHGKTPVLSTATRPNSDTRSSLEANLAYSLRLPPDDALDSRDGGVCVHFEALRDVKAGEELLIDYSDRWWETKGDRPV
mmetsp:Transcript_34306/g.77522  ORF Transcript_34306/g.77522 Transcript_34306/m.77522 type:complete len:225 (-) Transcript_34306:286-960(-)